MPFNRAVSRGALLVLAAVLASDLRPGKAPEQIEQAAALWKSPSALDTVQLEFDPAYAAFLVDVRARVPPEATVCVLAAADELHVYGAAFSLAPRRVVDRDRCAEAPYVAVYEGSAPEPLGSMTIRHGGLQRR